MKKILIAVVLALNTLCLGTAHAETCETSLGVQFSWLQAQQLCKVFGSAMPISLIPSADNAVDLGSASKQWRTLYTGTSILNAGDTITSTAAKGFVAGATARAANVTTATTLAVPLYIQAAAAGTDLGAFVGTGATTSGGVVDFFKTRATTGQASTIVVSGDTIGTVKFLGANGTTYDPAAAIIVKVDGTPGASADMPGSIDFQVSPDGSATLASALKLTNDKKATFGGLIVSGAAAAAGDIAFTNSGNTLSIQEATAGAACSGTATANGASDVVVTTSCATTGSRIMLTRTSTLAANLAEAWVKSISTGVSFTINAVASNTSTYNWVIFHEAP